jgi:NADH-quinone oxidoreductase subunit M
MNKLKISNKTIQWFLLYISFLLEESLWAILTYAVLSAISDFNIVWLVSLLPFVTLVRCVIRNRTLVATYNRAEGLGLIEIALSIYLVFAYCMAYNAGEVGQLSQFLAGSVTETNNYFFMYQEITFGEEYKLFSVGLDSLNLAFIVLTNIVMYVSYALVKKLVKEKQMEFMFLLFSIHGILLAAFTTTNLFQFFLFFEIILVPMYFIIGHWGHGLLRYRAARSFMLYTLLGSSGMLISVAYLLVTKGDLGLLSLVVSIKNDGTAENKIIESFLFFSFLIAFAFKMPIMPFHGWLPIAHGEAPTIGSMILASLLLKLGGYGMVRFLLVLFPQLIVTYSYLCIGFCFISAFVAGMVMLTQVDVKRIIAYSSIMHMSVALIGLFTFNTLGVVGFVYSMLSHGFVSAGLFLVAGILLDRYNTKLLGELGGLASVLPKLSFFFFVFTLVNIGFPPASGFLSEIFIIFALTDLSKVLALILISFQLPMTIGFIWTFSRVFFGIFKTPLLEGEKLRVLNVNSLGNDKDLGKEELSVMRYFIVCILMLTINVSFVVTFLSQTINVLLSL